MEKMVRFLDKTGQRHEAIDMMEACKDTEDLRTLYIDMLIEWKMYDEALELMDISDVDEENLEKYAKYMSEADQRLVVQDIIKRMKLRAPECKKGSDYDHFVGWIMSFITLLLSVRRLHRRLRKR